MDYLPPYPLPHIPGSKYHMGQPAKGGPDTLATPHFRVFAFPHKAPYNPLNGPIPLCFPFTVIYPFKKTAKIKIENVRFEYCEGLFIAYREFVYMKTILERWNRFLAEDSEESTQPSIEQIKGFFHSPEILALAPPRTREYPRDGSPWVLGGCLIAAEAIQTAFGGRIIGLDAEAGDELGDDLVHVVIAHKGGYLDALGFHRSISDIEKMMEEDYFFDQPVEPIELVPDQIAEVAKKSGLKRDKRLSDDLAKRLVDAHGQTLS
jgi:hypothetical protein